MKLSFLFSSAVFASVVVSAVASSPSWAQYTLTTDIVHPDPSRMNRISDVAMTDDYLVAGARTLRRPGDPGQVFVFDVTGEHLLRTIDDPHYRGFHSLNFGTKVAVDGNHIAVADYLDNPRVVHIFDAESGVLRHSLESPVVGHPDFAGSALDVHGDYVVVGAESVFVGPSGPLYPAEVYVFDAVSGALRHRLLPPEGVPVSSWGRYVEVSGTTIAIGSPRVDDAKVFFYDAETGDSLGTIAHPQISTFDTLSMSGNQLLLGQIRGEAFLIDTAGNLLQTFESPGIDPMIGGAYFEFSGSNVLVGSFGSFYAGATIVPDVRLYDATSGALLQTFTDAIPADRYFAVESTPSGDHIAFVRGRSPLFIADVLVYSKVPEPSSAILALLGAGVAHVLYSKRTSAIT